MSVNASATTKARKMLRDVNIPDEKVFLSNAFRDFMVMRISWLCKAYGVPEPKLILFSEPMNPTATAWTDGNTIHLNVSHESITVHKERSDKVLIIVGRLLHELMHILKTDFVARKRNCDAIAMASLYPDMAAEAANDAVLKERYEDFCNWLYKHKLVVPLIQQRWASFDNILEDGFIEDHSFVVANGVLLDGMSFKRACEYKAFPDAAYFIANNDGSAITAMAHMESFLLSAAKYGRLKYDKPEELTYPPLAAVYECRDLIDKCIYERSSFKRTVNKNMLFLMLAWPFYKKAFEENAQKAANRKQDVESSQQAQGKGSGLSSKKLEQNQSGSQNSTRRAKMASSSSKASDDDESKKSSGNNGKQDDENEAKNSGSKSGSSQNKSGDEDSEQSSNGTGSQADQNQNEDTGSKKSDSKSSKGKDKDDSDNGEQDGNADISNDDTDTNDADDSKDDGSSSDSADGDTDDGSQSDGEDGDSDNEEQSESEGQDSASGDSEGEDSDDSQSDEDAKKDDGDAKDNGDSDSNNEQDAGDDDGDMANYEPDAETMQSIQSMLNIILRKAREEIIEQQQQSMVTEKLRIDLLESENSQAHKDIELRVRRPHKNSVPDSVVEEYERNAAPMESAAHEMAKKMGFLKRADPEPLALSGFRSGNKFNASNIYSGDGRFFSKNIVPVPQKTIAIEVLVDLSMSMTRSVHTSNGYVSNIGAARNAALSILLFCREVGIPCAVFGHTASGSCPTMDIDVFADFDFVDKNDKYRVFDMTPRDSNRDGGALAAVGKHLLNRKEDTKLLITISDGLPNAYCYTSHAAIEDTAKIAAGLRKKGITLFAAAIGDNKDQIQGIYKEGFMDITNLDNLPSEMLGLVRRYVRRH